MAAHRSKKAFRPRTQQAYSAIFLKFLTFLSSHDFPFAPPPLPSILALLEHLVSLGLSSPTIQNHVSALKSSYLRHSLPAPALHHPLVSRLLKAIDRSVPRVLTPKDIFTLPQFQALIQATGSHPLGIFLTPATFSLSLFWLSQNLQPPSPILHQLGPPLHSPMAGCLLGSFHHHHSPPLDQDPPESVPNCCYSSSYPQGPPFVPCQCPRGPLVCPSFYSYSPSFLQACQWHPYLYYPGPGPSGPICPLLFPGPPIQVPGIPCFSSFRCLLPLCQSGAPPTP